MSYHCRPRGFSLRLLVAPLDAESMQTTVVPAAGFPDWLASQRATINWQRHQSKSYKSKAPDRRSTHSTVDQPKTGLRVGLEIFPLAHGTLLSGVSWATYHAITTNNYIESLA
ncbi:BZ3500_MvSof-1268-A1-R1_Chr2-1g04654 [Microbotryum saponariae]|uniref:BZ3500_MvSof-1268-A1-R1_Chr2-1g04654 protein n=1 Tax=Microbotryum saponariae TaxID=289078 RepID=A0A2X0MCB7_9BASI|nr:BZ3500_MvSof-1268-A1-R1_Chr2-1g04654 [Microbotryum saponariae]SCZ92227.1 BZ3501_MvSof-1269-A2-R1_Chr2-1g04310 [Microbotryum saponariae]